MTQPVAVDSRLTQHDIDHNPTLQAQLMLAALGDSVGQHGIDGDAKNAAPAIKAFQHKNHLPATGKLDDNTMAELAGQYQIQISNSPQHPSTIGEHATEKGVGLITSINLKNDFAQLNAQHKASTVGHDMHGVSGGRDAETSEPPLGYGRPAVGLTR